MSVAAAQYSKFCEQVVSEARAFTFVENGDLLVYPLGGREVVPFWSSRRRLVTIQKRMPKFKAFAIAEFTFADFLQRLTELSAHGIHIGVNWSGERLSGYDVSVAELLASLRHQVNRERRA